MISLVTLVVADYDEAIAFYVDQVGFGLVEDTDQGDGKRWVVVAPPGDGAGLLLARAGGPAQVARVGDQTGGRVGTVAVFEDLYGNRWDLIEPALSAGGDESVEHPDTELQ